MPGHDDERRQIIERLDAIVPNPPAGLPEGVFLFVSRVTPLVNVDLPIKDERNRTLLTWREDGWHGPGWHVPGGIVRLRQSLVDRAVAGAKLKLGVRVSVQPAPLAMNEIILPGKTNRSHFISFLFPCALQSLPSEELQCDSNRPNAGEWKWHRDCPTELLQVHEVYRSFIS